MLKIKRKNTFREAKTKGGKKISANGGTKKTKNRQNERLNHAIIKQQSPTIKTYISRFQRDKRGLKIPLKAGHKNPRQNPPKMLKTAPNTHHQHPTSKTSQNPKKIKKPTRKNPKKEAKKH
jgi:hypothetical protein